MGKYIDQLGPPAFKPISQPAAQLRQRLSPLGIRARVNQVGNRLGLGQVNLAGEKRALRKLARFGQPQTRQCRECASDGLYRGPAAMNMQFHHVFTGKAGRAGKPDRQPVIQRAAIQRIHHTAPYGPPRFR